MLDQYLGNCASYHQSRDSTTVAIPLSLCRDIGDVRNQKATTTAERPEATSSGIITTSAIQTLPPTGGGSSERFGLIGRTDLSFLLGFCIFLVVVV